MGFFTIFFLAIKIQLFKLIFYFYDRVFVLLKMPILNTLSRIVYEYREKERIFFSLFRYCFNY